MSESTTFAAALRVARRNTTNPESGGHLTQDRLADLIGQRLGMIGQPTGATIGNWERNISRPSQRDRDILVSLIAILVKYGGLRSPADANRLLTLGGYAPLTAEEEAICFGEASPPGQPPNVPASPFTVPVPMVCGR
jgi:hypothetical protein